MARVEMPGYLQGALFYHGAVRLDKATTRSPNVRRRLSVQMRGCLVYCACTAPALLSTRRRGRGCLRFEPCPTGWSTTEQQRPHPAGLAQLGWDAALSRAIAHDYVRMGTECGVSVGRLAGWGEGRGGTTSAHGRCWVVLGGGCWKWWPARRGSACDAANGEQAGCRSGRGWPRAGSMAPWRVHGWAA